MGNYDPLATVPATGIHSSSPAASDFPPGTKVERYVVLRELGRGGMGAVYAAYDSELDRRVALKFLRNSATGADADDWRARLMREAKAMARLSHPNVVTLYDVGLSSAGRVFLAMEVVEGGTLGDWLKAKPRTWREVVALLCEAGEGLAAAHRAGMIHRDFKLENVLFGTDGRPRVTDFGLARSAGEEAEEELQHDAASTRKVSTLHDTLADRLLAAREATGAGSLSSKLTLTGALMGTPGYMAPEQYTNAGDIDARADIFAFCATLYRALHGERAFEGNTVEAIAESTLLGRIRATPKGSPVPAWLHKVIAWGLATEREARPASMEELLAALRADPTKRWRRRLLGGAAVVACCAVAVGVHAAGAKRVRACHAMADRLDGVWDAPRKQAIQQALVATRVSYAEDTWTRVEKRLDDYAAALTSTTQGACEATRVRGEQSEAMLDLRASCLEERLDELHALGDALANADARTVGKAVRAASSLPSLDPCSALDQLSAATRLPSEPAKRAEIRALRAEIAAATEIRLTGGSSTRSWKRLEPIQQRVMATGFGPLVTAWTVAAVQARTDHDLKDTAAEWEGAIELADTYHLDRVRADGQMRLGLVLNDLGEHEEARLFLALSGATLARIGGDPALGLERDMYEGLNFLNEGKYVDAVRVLEPAILHANAAHVADRSRVAIAETLLGGGAPLRSSALRGSAERGAGRGRAERRRPRSAAPQHRHLEEQPLGRGAGGRAPRRRPPLGLAKSGDLRGRDGPQRDPDPGHGDRRGALERGGRPRSPGARAGSDRRDREVARGLQDQRPGRGVRSERASNAYAASAPGRMRLRNVAWPVASNEPPPAAAWSRSSFASLPENDSSAPRSVSGTSS